ncbi:hypothetical protein PCK1_001028 [Pneumocystis canis]|nr:hypothetical protein PCK1_001028 [Pneumocystis canis]
MISSSTFFRSEEISLVQFYFPVEVAKLIVFALGELGMIHFRDLNVDINVFQRAFIKEIRRLDETERQLQFLLDEIKKTDIKMTLFQDDDTAMRVSNPHQTDELCEKIAFFENRVRCLNESYQTLEKQYLGLIERRYVLYEIDQFLNKNHDVREGPVSTNIDMIPLLENDVEQNAMNPSGLLGISVLLSQREGKIGTPEKPLSYLGLVSYRNYWKIKMCYELCNLKKPTSIQEISKRTSMTPDDVISTLERLDALVYDSVSKIFLIQVDKNKFQEICNKWMQKGYQSVKPNCLKWVPFLQGKMSDLKESINISSLTLAQQNPHVD